MITATSASHRTINTSAQDADLVIVGGGVAGTCAAITAAREGLRVILVQDRPVLGGNASSEVRLWLLGATSHLGNNNRWSREGGVINELLEENLYRNRLGNPLIFDTILLEKVINEPHITLLLNTAVYEVEKSSTAPDSITSVTAFCPQNSTRYQLSAPLFCDASGDGIVGFLAGAAFRMGAESKEEFGEGFAPDASYGELLGHSLYFYSKDTGTPVKYIAPSWAHKNAADIAKFRKINANMQGCNFWWVEFGGRLDTVHDTEEIKWELWRIVYGIWDYIKNSGKFPEAETMTLEWVGHIPGKRESRRFEGDYMIRQQDVIEQTRFEDVVAHGGWSLDLHPSDGVYSEASPCNQWHSKGVYAIPYRSLYSRNINNLFLAGRIISASHVAFGSTRVMATCAAAAQAVAVAAAICNEQDLSPCELSKGQALADLQLRLDRSGQFLPGKTITDSDDLVASATVIASSTLHLSEFPETVFAPCPVALESDWAMLLPLTHGTCPTFTLKVDTDSAATLRAELWHAEKHGNFCMDEQLASIDVSLLPNTETDDAIDVFIDFQINLPRAGYYFLKISGDSNIQLRTSDERVTGVLSVTNACNKKVATSNVQSPPPGIGIDSFEFWLPQRRPDGLNLALQISPPLDAFSPENITCGPARPTDAPNAWVADRTDPSPEITLQWDLPATIRRVVIEFDPDWDHPMESVLMTHSEEVVPFMVKDFDLIDDEGNTLATIRDHHNARFVWAPESPLTTRALTVKILSTYGSPATIHRLRVW